MRFLNSKEIKLIREAVEHDFGFFFEGEFAFLENNKGRIFMVSREIERIAFDTLRTDRMGLYVLQREEFGFRLSKEGAQLLVTQAKVKGITVKKLVPLNQEEVIHYFSGENLYKETEHLPGYVLLSFREEILGCAKYSSGKIYNFLPKSYRGTIII